MKSVVMDMPSVLGKNLVTEIMQMGNYSWWAENNGGQYGSKNKTRAELIRDLAQRTKQKERINIVEAAIKKGTLFDVCNVDSMNDQDLIGLIDAGIIDYTVLSNRKGYMSRHVRIGLFAAKPNNETYKLISDRIPSKDEYGVLVRGKAGFKLKKYGLSDTLKLHCYDWGEYVSKGRKSTDERLAEFKSVFHTFRNKSDVRAMLFNTPLLMSVLDTSDYQRSPLTAKELCSFINRDLKRADRKDVITRDLYEWLEQEIFMETLSGKSKVSKPMQKNLDELLEILEEKEDPNYGMESEGESAVIEYQDHDSDDIDAMVEILAAHHEDKGYVKK